MEPTEGPGTAPGEEGGPPPRPSWVRWLLVALAIAALVVLVTMLIIGGEHGPGRHS